MSEFTSKAKNMAEFLGYISSYPGSNARQLAKMYNQSSVWGIWETGSKAGQVAKMPSGAVKISGIMVVSRLHALKRLGAKIHGDRYDGYFLMEDFQFCGKVYPKSTTRRTPISTPELMQSVEDDFLPKVPRRDNYKSTRITHSPHEELEALEKANYDIMAWVNENGTSHPDFFEKIRQRNSNSVQIEIKRQQISGQWTANDLATVQYIAP